MTRFRTVAMLAALLLGGVSHSSLTPRAQAAEPDGKQVEKVLKRLIGAIRYGKSDLAAQQLSFGRMAEGLLREAWQDIPATDRTLFTERLEALVRGISFRKGNEMFARLDAVLYEPARIKGDEARCKSTVVVHRNYKKTEMAIDWVLHRDNGAWKVWDIEMLGESTVRGLREDQVEPLMDEGGVALVLSAMADKLAGLPEDEKKN